jgi:hypothetical protein
MSQPTNKALATWLREIGTGNAGLRQLWRLAAERLEQSVPKEVADQLASNVQRALDADGSRIAIVILTDAHNAYTAATKETP